MTRQTWIVAVLVLGMIAAAAWRLDSAGARQKLGVPGVRVRACDVGVDIQPEFVSEPAHRLAEQAAAAA